MKKVLAAIVTFIFSVCLIATTVATVSAASVKKVSNFKATSTPVAVTLTWKKTSGATGYEIQQKVSKKWKTVATIKKAKTTSYTVKKLKNGKTYQFRIRAVKGKSKGAYVSLKVKTSVSSVTSFKGTVSGLTTAKFTWTKPANVTGYEIQRKDGSKWKTVTKIKKAKTTSYTDKKVPANATTTYRIRGYLSLNGKTYYGSYTEAKVKTTVAPMKKVSVKSVTSTSATVTWSKVSGATGYEVEKYVSGKWVDAHSKVLSSKTTSYTVSGLSSLTSYKIRVRAVQKVSKTNYYNSWVTVNAKTTIGAASGVAVSSVTTSSAKVTWKAAGGATAYRVLNNGKEIADVKTNSVTLSVAAGTTYKISVVPYAGSVTGAATSAVTFTTPCAKVSGVKVATTESTATVSWSKVKGATSYQVQYCKDGGSWSSNVSVTSTSYSLKNLPVNTVYKFRVRALNKNGSSTQYGEYSSVASASTYGLTFSKDTVSWGKVTGASYYVLQHFNAETGAWEAAASKLTATKYTNSTLCSDESKLFKVIAYNSKKAVIYTSTVASSSVSPFAFSLKDNVLSISWGAFDGASKYEVVISSQGIADGGKTVLTVKESERSISRALAPGLTYDVEVLAIKSNKETAIARFTVTTGNLTTGTSDKEVNAQLLYLVEAINRSKFDDSKRVVLKLTPHNVNEIKYMDFGFQVGKDPLGVKAAAVNGLLKLLFGDYLTDLTDKGNDKDYEIEDGFIKCYKPDAIDAVFASMDGGTKGESIAKTETGGRTYNYTFNNGAYYGSADYKLSELVQPSGNVDGLAYLYNAQNASAWKNGFSKVETTKTEDGYKIEATLKAETNPLYHNGFVAGTNSGDFGLGDLGGTNVDNKVGATTLVAEIDENCRLVSYKIVSPYECDMKVTLSLNTEDADLESGTDDEATAELKGVMKLLDKIVIEMNVDAEGCQEYTYSFARTY